MFLLPITPPHYPKFSIISPFRPSISTPFLTSIPHHSTLTYHFHSLYPLLPSFTIPSYLPRSSPSFTSSNYPFLSPLPLTSYMTLRPSFPHPSRHKSPYSTHGQLPHNSSLASRILTHSKVFSPSARKMDPPSQPCCVIFVSGTHYKFLSRILPLTPFQPHSFSRGEFSPPSLRLSSSPSFFVFPSRPYLLNEVFLCSYLTF